MAIFSFQYKGIRDRPYIGPLKNWKNFQDFAWHFSLEN